MHLEVIGTVRSSITERDDAPRQGDEGAPDVWLEVHDAYANAMQGLQVGDSIVVLTWLHQADRATLLVHPRGDRAIPLTGVFATRSPDRPNPIGLHRVTIKRIEGLRIMAGPLEAIDGTPIIDIKPLLSGDAGL